MQRFSRSLIAVIVLILVAGGALPAEEALPPAQKIIDDYVDAIGGRKLLKKQESFEVVGTFSIPAAGLTGELEIYSKAPNMNLVRIELPGIGQIQEGFDGKVAWVTDPTQGPMVKDGKAAEQALFRSDFYAALHEEGRYKSMETVEQVEFEGRDCYKVRLVTSGDDEVFEYYDLETKFMVGTDTSAETPMGAVDITAVMEEYKAFGGLSLPTKITQKMVGMAQVMTIAEVQANTLDSAVFELPAAIKALSEPAPEAAK